MTKLSANFWEKTELMFKNIAQGIDLSFHKYKFFRDLSCLYFDLTSRLTNFFLNIRVVFYLLCLSAFLVGVVYSQDITSILLFYESGQLGPVSPFVVFFLGFLFVLFDMVMINSALVHSQIVREYMIQRYGESVFKLRGYNSPLSSIRKIGAVAGSLFTGIVIISTKDVAIAFIEEKEQTERYKIYTQTLPPGEVPVAPEVYPRRTSGGPTFASQGIK